MNIYIEQTCAYNACSWTKVDGFNGHHSVGIVIEEAYKFLQQPKATNTALQAAGSTFRTFVLALLQPERNTNLIYLLKKLKHKTHLA